MYYVIGKNNCPWCEKAKADLEKENTAYVYKNLDKLNENKRDQWKDFIVNELGMNTVPVVFKMIGGSNELKKELGDKYV
jgi:glutaredoxin